MDPASVDADLKLGRSSLKNGDLNKGTAAQEILGYVDSIKEYLGPSKINGETLQLRKVDKTARGFSLRFVQRHNRVRIQGAEVVALLDRQGNLLSLNSSLVRTPKISVQPELSREQALYEAASRLGYGQAEEGQGANDGLLVTIASNGAPLLVWQFSLREYATGENPMQVQVVAQGQYVGQVWSALSLSHDAAGAIKIYDASVSIVIPNPLFKGVLVLDDGKPTLRGRLILGQEAKDAHSSFDNVREFYSEQFGRESWDDNGADIVASVNAQRISFIDPLGQKQNASWMAPWKMFTFGAGGDLLDDFTKALDVVGHEYTHAVVSSSSNLEYVHESGALNEHLADVFGVMIEQKYQNPVNPFLLGDTVLRGELSKYPALRDMLNPAKGVSEQPGHVNEIEAEFGPNCQATMNNDNCGVHILSGIPNRASALMIQALGWEKLYPLFYQVMTVRLRANSKFSDYKDQMLAECDATMSAFECEQVRESLAAVGL